jgi:hypothetical protein
MAGSIITAFAVLFKQLEKLFDIGSQSSSGSDTDSLAPGSKSVDKSQVNIELTDWQPDPAITQHAAEYSGYKSGTCWKRHRRQNDEVGIGAVSFCR